MHTFIFLFILFVARGALYGKHERARERHTNHCCCFSCLVLLCRLSFRLFAILTQPMKKNIQGRERCMHERTNGKRCAEKQSKIGWKTHTKLNTIERKNSRERRVWSERKVDINYFIVLVNLWVYYLFFLLFFIPFYSQFAWCHRYCWCPFVDDFWSLHLPFFDLFPVVLSYCYHPIK